MDEDVLCIGLAILGGKGELMKHSVAELMDVVYSYYPRGLLTNDPRYNESQEYRRLVDARRQAGAHNAPWNDFLGRLCARFPGNVVQNRSLHLPTGGWDACYSGRIDLPTSPGEYHHTVGFMVSFLIPYYVIYSSRIVDDLAEIDRIKARRAKPPRHVGVSVPNVPDTMFILPAGLVKPEFIDPPPPIEARRNDINFDFSPDEQPFAAWLAHDIEATWPGHERMPPEIGNVSVSGVASKFGNFGEARLYDCLFSDDW